MRRLSALLSLLILVAVGCGLSTLPPFTTLELETIADATVEERSRLAGSEEPIQASTPSQGTGAVEVLTLDSSVLVSESKVFGAALLQGRGAGDHSGTEIEVFRDGQPLQSVLMTSGDGAFSATLSTGDYRLVARHPGWLPEARDFAIEGTSTTVDLGTLVLAAGDADGDQQIGSADLQRFRRSLGQSPSPQHTDSNQDGVTDVLDLALAGLNFGRAATLGCPASPAGDDGGPTILGTQASISPTNSLIVNVDVTIDTPSKVYVEYENSKAGRFRSKMTDTLRTGDRVSVVRLRPSTTYCDLAFAVDGEGLISDGVAGSFTTGPLPAGLQGSSFDVVRGQPTYPLTLKDHTDADFSGIVTLDSQAKIVWYYPGSRRGSDRCRPKEQRQPRVHRQPLWAEGNHSARQRGRPSRGATV